MTASTEVSNRTTLMIDGVTYLRHSGHGVECHVIAHCGECGFPADLVFGLRADEHDTVSVPPAMVMAGIDRLGPCPQCGAAIVAVSGLPHADD